MTRSRTRRGRLHADAQERDRAGRHVEFQRAAVPAGRLLSRRFVSPSGANLCGPLRRAPLGWSRRARRRRNVGDPPPCAPRPSATSRQHSATSRATRTRGRRPRRDSSSGCQRFGTRSQVTALTRLDVVKDSPSTVDRWEPTRVKSVSPADSRVGEGPEGGTPESVASRAPVPIR